MSSINGVSTVSGPRWTSRIRRRLMPALAIAAAAWISPDAAQAQNGVSVQRVQATPPTEGSRGWAQDNCFYVYQGGAWRGTDMCRVMRAQGVYDTFSPSQRRWMVRIDESRAGWMGFTDLNTPGAWIYGSNDGSRIYAVVNGQWIDLKAAAASRAGAAGSESAAQIIARNKANPALQAQIAQAQALVAASNARGVSSWVAPNCVSSYNGCR